MNALNYSRLRGGVFRGNFASQLETNRGSTRFAPIQHEAEGHSSEAMVEERTPNQRASGQRDSLDSNPQSRWVQAAISRVVG